jgi:putative hydroxymethylpyrimidine transport system substrate-binding protein
VDLAVSYQPQTIIAAARGLEIAAVGRLIEHPLTTLLFLEARGFSKPADLSGLKIGYTVPGLMDILLAAFAKINHIDSYTPVNVGFAIVQALTAGQVDAVMGPFKTYETVTMRHKGIRAAFFELEKWGIPDYDELIFVCSHTTRQKKEAPIRAFVQAIDEAIARVRANPQQALKSYFAAVAEADRKIEADAFALTLPYFAHTQHFDHQKWQRFADFAVVHGLIPKPVNVAAILPAKAAN